MIPVSLCVLVHDNVDGLYRLIDSVKAFQGLDVSIIVGDNSSDPKNQALARVIADEYFIVTDRDLWEDGFGPTKQKIVAQAKSDWAIIADPDEVWSPIPLATGWAHLTLLDEHAGAGVFRTMMPEENGHGKQHVFHGRIFDRKKCRIIGLIHEEVFGRRDRRIWGEIAPSQAFAVIDHRPDEASPVYIKRKVQLYDQLILRASRRREAYGGTNSWWFDTYLPRRLAEGLKPMTFEEWEAGSRS